MTPILHLSRLLERDHIPLVLATYPQPWQVSAEATPIPPIRDQYQASVSTRCTLNDRPFRKLEAFAAEHQIPFVNATSAFRQDATPVTLFLGNDFHFTPRRASALRRRAGGLSRRSRARQTAIAAAAEASESRR